ncbi:MAG: DNA phosphorothioation-associated putative methyltransferase [Candidatus Scalindua sp.]|jgi:DNA phosphorothioation-associated putative methyltransferase|nr:DNA phosphorothioation-associated putative methyltransferase [Candidatus Scalindua sp.]
MNQIPKKTVGRNVYFHRDSLELLDIGIREKIHSATELAGADAEKNFNIIRVEEGGESLSLLCYSSIYEEAFPALHMAWKINPHTSIVSYRSYHQSSNPPILHRKELLLSQSHPRYKMFCELTKSAESLGLFDDVSRIGYQKQWLDLINRKGYLLDGHQLIPLANCDDVECEVSDTEPVEWKASRQLTALTRFGFSAPIQTLMRNNYLDGRYTLFDYGCGRGSDVDGLQQNNLHATGWDPYYAPDDVKVDADIVNLGFVLNVIESLEERVDALIGAYSYASKVLVVSVMLDNSNRATGRKYNDGVITQRGTFQKYYTQAEIKNFIEVTLDEEALAIAPGIHYVFSDKDEEQRFLSTRYKRRRNRLRTVKRLSAEEKEAIRSKKLDQKYIDYKQQLDRLLLQCLSLGRDPDKTECSDLEDLIEGFGTYNKALRFISQRNDIHLIEGVAQDRTEDLLVYFALNKFEKRAPYKNMEASLQRDIKSFFGSYSCAQNEARQLLFLISNTELIHKAVIYASNHGLGCLGNDESLQLHTQLVNQLPSILRVYIGCASVLYGDYRNADIVKIHTHSGKVSLITCNDFTCLLPKMNIRVKISLREQDFNYYNYTDGYEPPYIYNKSLYINEEYPTYPEQIYFEETISKFEELDFDNYGPSVNAFNMALFKRRLQINGAQLVMSKAIPSMDDPCGQFLTFRDLIQCGETQQQTRLPNIPTNVQSYNALTLLALNIIDPVVDYFGMLNLTYGFCSPELARKITGRIAPKLDQHASHELNRLGNQVCSRLGAACDFIVDDESMLEVAQWIVVNTDFDRLYFYGDALPLHVSYGPDHSKQIVIMTLGKTQRLIPKVTSIAKFKELKP